MVVLIWRAAEALTLRGFCLWTTLTPLIADFLQVSFESTRRAGNPQGFAMCAVLQTLKLAILLNHSGCTESDRSSSF